MLTKKLAKASLPLALLANSLNTGSLTLPENWKASSKGVQFSHDKRHYNGGIVYNAENGLSAVIVNDNFEWIGDEEYESLLYGNLAKRAWILMFMDDSAYDYLKETRNNVEKLDRVKQIHDLAKNYLKYASIYGGSALEALLLGNPSNLDYSKIAYHFIEQQIGNALDNFVAEHPGTEIDPKNLERLIKESLNNNPLVGLNNAYSYLNRAHELFDKHRKGQDIDEIEFYSYFKAGVILGNTYANLLSNLDNVDYEDIANQVSKNLVKGTSLGFVVNTLDNKLIKDRRVQYSFREAEETLKENYSYFSNLEKPLSKDSSDALRTSKWFTEKIDLEDIVCNIPECRQLRMIARYKIGDFNNDNVRDMIMIADDKEDEHGLIIYLKEKNGNWNVELVSPFLVEDPEYIKLEEYLRYKMHDMNHDGKQEIIFEHVSPGTGHYLSYSIFTFDDGKPKDIPVNIYNEDEIDHGILYLTENGWYTERPVYTKQDEYCCPSSLEFIEYEFRGNNRILQTSRRKEPSKIK